MRLKIRIIDAPAVSGGKAVALCDENGAALPCQVRAVLDNGVDHNSVTVEFFIDGDRIAIEPA